MSAKRGLRIRGLRQRWLVNAVLPIVLVVIAIVTVYTLGVRRTYYSAMRSGLETRARVAADNFSSSCETIKNSNVIRSKRSTGNL